MDLSERRGGASRHPWEVARARFFRRLVAREVPVGDVRAVLDVGAGDGWLAGELSADLDPSTRIVCWDVNYTPDDLDDDLPAHVERTVDAPDGTFDLVLALDVLEHIEDDEGFLTGSLVPRLAPGGRLVVSVPVHPGLYSAHDEALGHVRRYRPGDLVDLLARHLTVVRHGSLFTTLLVPRALAAGVERLGRTRPQTGVGAWQGGPGLTRTVTAVLEADARLGLDLAGRRWAPPGLSHWAVCARPLA